MQPSRLPGRLFWFCIGNGYCKEKDIFARKKMMKNISGLFAAAMLLASCAGTSGGFRTECASFADSTKYCTTIMNVELPSGDSKAESLIRDTLVAYLDRECRNAGYREEEAQIESYNGNDVKDCVDHYGKILACELNALATADESYYPWEYNIGISISRKTDKYVVFNCSNYVYLGGAHGGVSGAGPMTFSLATGEKIRHFIKDSALMPLQAELRKGVLSYFRECEEDMTEEDMMGQLFIEDGIIPLPAMQPEPSDNGLILTYQQYEIACYAAGMPSFCLPYELVAPYLTEEAKSIL